MYAAIDGGTIPINTLPVNLAAKLLNPVNAPFVNDGFTSNPTSTFPFAAATKVGV